MIYGERHQLEQAFELEPICIPEFETCLTEEVKHEYEQLEDYSRSLGIFTFIYALFPLLTFIYPTFLGVPSESRTETFVENHLFYSMAWFFLISSHLVLLLPFASYWAWISLNNADTIENKDFYSFWLETYIVNSIRPVFYFNMVMFFLVYLWENVSWMGGTGED